MSEIQQSQKDYIFGTRAVIEAINANKSIDKLLMVKQNDNELHNSLKRLAKKNQISIVFVPLEKLNRVTRKNHQGVIAYLNLIEYSSLDFILSNSWEKGVNPFLLILDRITDTRNFGAIARAAECAGVHAIIVPEKSSARINADAIKTSAGALHYIPVCKVKSIPTVIDELNNNGLTTIGLSEKAKVSIYDINVDTPLALVLGSEDEGIQKEVINRLHYVAKIPMKGKIQSLNVSVAAGISLFHIERQRSKLISKK